MVDMEGVCPPALFSAQVCKLSANHSFSGVAPRASIPSSPLTVLKEITMPDKRVTAKKAAM